MTDEELERIEYHPLESDCIRLVAEVRRLRGVLAEAEDAMAGYRAALFAGRKNGASMAEVTREHRRLALLAHGVLERHVSAWSEWLAFGGDVFETRGHTHCMVDENASAQAIADAEQRGREAANDDAVLLARLRAHPSLDAVLRVIGGGSGSYAECAGLLLKLLRG